MSYEFDPLEWRKVKVKGETMYYRDTAHKKVGEWANYNTGEIVNMTQTGEYIPENEYARRKSGMTKADKVRVKSDLF